MPSQILHTLFGEDVIAALPRLKVNDAHRGAFALGCQGPDIFYHNRRSRPVALEYGILLHRRNYGIFCAQLQRNGDIFSDNALSAYTWGFLTHAALDRFCHPYIIYQAGDTAMHHPFFERIIDVLMLKRLRGQTASSWNQKLLALTCENPPPDLKELIYRALIAAFPEKAGKDSKLIQRIDNALSDSARYYFLSDPAETCLNVWRITNRPPVDRRHVSLLYPENLPDDVDFLNIQREPWFYPYQMPHAITAPVPDTRSFVDIYEDAVQAAINSLQNPGNDCLSIHDETGKPCAPNCTAPLPLDKVLEEQVKMRN